MSRQELEQTIAQKAGTLKQLSKKSGVPVQSLGTLLRKGTLGRKNLVAIADALGIDFDHLNAMLDKPVNLTLEKARLNVGYETMSAFAEAAGIPYSDYRAYEATSAEPTREHAEVIAKMTGVSTEKILASSVNNDRKNARPTPAEEKPATPEELEYEIGLANPDVELLERVRKGSEPVRARCCACGHEWNAIPTQLAKPEKACPKCKAFDYGKELAEQIAENNPFIEMVGEYVDFKTRIACRCTNCGFEWDVHPMSLKKGIAKCPGCQGGKVPEPKQDTAEQRAKNEIESLISTFEKAYPSLTLKGRVNEASDYMVVACKKCGSEWTSRKGSLFGGQTCVNCRVSNLQEQFKEAALAKNPHYELLSEYFDDGAQVHCRCKKCGRRRAIVAGDLRSKKLPCKTCAAKKKRLR